MLKQLHGRIGNIRTVFARKGDAAHR